MNSFSVPDTIQGMYTSSFTIQSNPKQDGMINFINQKNKNKPSPLSLHGMQQWYSNVFNVHQNHLEGLLKLRLMGLYSDLHKFLIQ